MAASPEIKVQISADDKGLKSNLNQVTAEFNRLYGSITKAADKTGTDASQRLAALTAKYQELADIAGSRDFLGLTAHKNIQAQIERTRKAYDLLKESGTLCISGGRLRNASRTA